MINQFTLDNGVRVVVEEMPSYHSVSAGIWVRAGSADEEEANNGVSHFIEHMCFKGTENRSAFEIAAEMDAMGAQINAFTSKECTCYHAKGTADKLDPIMDVLSDIVTRSVFDEAEMEKEKGVVIEEISMTNDSPEDLAHETISEVYFDGNPVGKPILGPADNVRAFTRQTIDDYMREYYSPERIVISVAGGIKTDDALKVCDKYMGAYRTGGNARPGDIEELSHTSKKSFKAITKDAEQVQVCLALAGFSFQHPKRYALSIVNNIFGGTMSSRLFQKVREQRGMAYSVFSYPSSYTRTGMFTVYAGTSGAMGAEVTQILMDELELLTKKGITREEYEKGRAQLKGSYVLSMESTSSKMNQNGKNMVLRNRIVTVEDELNRLASITLDDCNEVCASLFNLDNICAAYVGKIDDEQALRDIIYK